jgi:Flp pilus assembly protein TadG
MMVLFAFILPVVVLFCGLTLDVGMVELRKTQMQTAADAAALGAVMEAERGPEDWVTQGQEDAAINGFTNGTNNVTVTIAQQPTYGPYAGRYDAIQATISQPVNTLFMGMLHGGKVTVTARAVALQTPCMYLTGNGPIGGYTLYGFTGSLLGVACPVNVNTSITVQPNAGVATDALSVAGSASSSSVSGFTYPSPYYGIPAVTDPLSSIAQPSAGACNHNNYSLSGGNATLNPGTYCGGLNLSNSNVALNPGLYVITGGATWSGGTITGSGVTLFFTKGSSSSYGQFVIENGATVTLSAPTSTANGGTTGVLVFADRSWVQTSAEDFELIGANVTADGIWYMPGAGFLVWSCGTLQANNYFGVIANGMFFAGTQFFLSNNYSGLSGGNPMRARSTLVE